MVGRIGPLVIERRPDPTVTWVLGVSVGAVLAALVATSGIFLAYGVSPIHAYVEILRGTFGSRLLAAEIVSRAIPLLLCGVGLALAFRAQFFNIGAEGQLLAGAMAATGVALFVPIPSPWLIPCMFAAGFAAGALWGFLPTLLRVRLDVNEIITTLMMNYIAIYTVQWLIHGPWRGETAWGFAYTDTFVEAARLPMLAGTRIHWPTLALGLVLAIGLAILLARTRLGFEARVIGQGMHAARYAGIDPGRTMILVMLLSAGAAGLAGVGEVAGIHRRLMDPVQVSLGYGYAAIIVAWLARGNPVATVLTALFLGFIFTAGDVLQVALRMPARITDVFNGLILLFLIGGERLMYYRVRWAPAPHEPAATSTPHFEPGAGGAQESDR
jgi:simple sugar transport system permease protein